jgi:hypothetical protein
MFVLHTCHIPKCVNPDHLHLGTARDNTGEMIAAGRRATIRGMQIGNSILTDQQASEILWLALNCPWLTQGQIGERYGVSEDVVGTVKRREKWRHVMPRQPQGPWKIEGFRRRV